LKKARESCVPSLSKACGEVGNSSASLAEDEQNLDQNSEDERVSLVINVSKSLPQLDSAQLDAALMVLSSGPSEENICYQQSRKQELTQYMCTIEYYAAVEKNQLE
jgi:hypothetical protein